MRNTAQYCVKRLQRNPGQCNTSDNSCSCQRFEKYQNYAHTKHYKNFAKSATFLSLFLLLVVSTSWTLAAPQTSCILCDKEDLRPREPPLSDSYEEFTFDHQVSRQEAIQALLKYNETQNTQNACNSLKCTPTVMKYCLGPQFINDHCWCELQHREEGLPYVPHICYVGEKVYKPSIGSCFLFEEVKECCCASALVREWRHISGASFTTPNNLLFSLLSLLSLLYWRSRRRSIC